jgi:hypothetical protein
MVGIVMNVLYRCLFTPILPVNCVSFGNELCILNEQKS